MPIIYAVIEVQGDYWMACILQYTLKENTEGW
jgi:hypothetical protein